MKAVVKATGEIVNVTQIGTKCYLYDLNNVEILDEPAYWEKLKHQYAGMAMQGILANCNHQLWKREANSEPIAKRSCEIATALVNQLKEESQCKE